MVSEGSTRDALNQLLRYSNHHSHPLLFCNPTHSSFFNYLPIQAVAVKQLDKDGLQGNREFLVEVLMLSLLHHPNLVSLIGYCADGDQRLLVYEFMPLGSLEDHLHGIILFFAILLSFTTILVSYINSYALLVQMGMILETQCYLRLICISILYHAPISSN